VKAAETLQPVQSPPFCFKLFLFGVLHTVPPKVRYHKVESAFAVLYDFPGCLLCLLLKYLQNHDGIIIDSNTIRHVLFLIIETEFVASRAKRWHRSRMRQREQLPSCSLRRNSPASILAALDSGGVFISPCSQTNAYLSFSSNINICPFLAIMSILKSPPRSK